MAIASMTSLLHYDPTVSCKPKPNCWIHCLGSTRMRAVVEREIAQNLCQCKQCKHDRSPHSPCFVLIEPRSWNLLFWWPTRIAICSLLLSDLIATYQIRFRCTPSYQPRFISTVRWTTARKAFGWKAAWLAGKIFNGWRKQLAWYWCSKRT